MKAVSINANDVRKMFKVCGACLDANGVFDASQYIKIEVRGNKATAIGCDGIRLATVTSTNVTTRDETEFDFFVKPVKIDKHATRIAFTINDDKSVTMSDGITSITTKYLANYIEWERIGEMNVPKQPVKIVIDTKMLVEALNALKDFKQNKRIVITVDAANANRPIFVEPIDGTAKTILCTCGDR